MDNLSERLKAIDRKLAEKNLRVSERPKEALEILCPTNISTPITIFNISDIPIIKNRELLTDITNWYKQLYGTNKVEGKFEIGQKPFLIRGEIYYTKHYVGYGMFTHPNILNDIEDLTDELARSLKEEEIESIINALI
jgi:hypothetical protein